MQMTCPHCQQMLLTEAIDLNADLAKCTACQAVFALTEAPVFDPSAFVQELSARSMPYGLTLEKGPDRLTFSWRWFEMKYVFLLFLSLLWNGLLWLWYRLTWSPDSLGIMDLIFLLFPLFHVAVGLGMVWTTLAGFFNRTYLRISPQFLTVHHKPIWMPGQKQLPCAEVNHLFCLETSHEHRAGLIVVKYEVHAQLKGGHKEKLVAMTYADQASALKDCLEQYLGLQAQEA